MKCLDFFGQLNWLNGEPLQIEPYRQRLLASALDTTRHDGAPVFNFVLSGRAKKNFKTTDLVLAGLYCLLFRDKDGANSDCFILANDEDQAGDDLSLAKKLILANPELAAALDVLQKEIRRRDGRGTLKILPAKDVAGSHGKTYVFIGFDEIHPYKTYDLLEALTADPTRNDVLTWITSYDSIYQVPGCAGPAANARPALIREA
jgi:phage terminase large subunit-like protein